jgi:hypothetical protein
MKESAMLRFASTVPVLGLKNANAPAGRPRHPAMPSMPTLAQTLQLRAAASARVKAKALVNASVLQLQGGDKDFAKPGKSGVAVRDRTDLAGLDQRIKNEMDYVEYKQRQYIKQMTDRPVISASKAETPYNKKFSAIMTFEYEFRDKYYSSFQKKLLRDPDPTDLETFESEYARTQMYLLVNNSKSYALAFDPNSPISVWKLLDLISMRYGGTSPQGTLKDGMTSERDKIPESYNRTIFQRGMGPELRFDNLGRVQWNYETTGKIGFPANTTRLQVGTAKKLEPGDL